MSKDLFALFREVGRLKRIKRTGWVLKGIKDSESVADHVFRTAFMCMVLGRKRKLDLIKLVNMALIHDLGETATSDIRYEEGKRIFASKDAKEKIEEDVLQMVLPSTGEKDYYLSLFYEFRDQTSDEARFLKEVEKLEMALQALEYQEFGVKPKLMDEFFENAAKYIKDKEIKKMFEKVRSFRS
ncbi:hypothetical protein A3D84_03570 [Candidatus Woesebacteria bacterium RIFCSPHIGHO2_02_FULL_42_20]|uniref:5'-deoxynucleotidase n=1 Tax=Candidatus Woesebacteria bacterium RIFCSPHIGHO2_12_FULL_41_24 TaxID=1802510 RepID=A0A1F8ATZ6_9BACT|nr:MAG: hypothetical protein A2W15_03720 [Candidatus Woesebacteria bacterium RBG_16_41_13]OGM29635.1 MAG: hypothetical protein A2873_03745 [Candidatus Woesebacteria bacterium RIFCSPHIGHO2_01_FULL_42_80]OGM35612.1 MAG: hypothetical protein A3D84_03570 [Candidatus Woesebacteria bacterium RIFCSPHIGHO2_02_FULL_42_20]OGM55223.1 MAG: hypothetical protein A3E44_02980 [Candidatus Woesebacteria bacterium RIFCSPHIGHO2_12_FULL_41_24]OGM67177.1 MAG: hypothetical protein A2969_04705 [Candidatus Woesebacteri